ncbi:helix-turn-helix domain-containing protein [Deinococcus aluminii]|uniref:Helix-turn-helix domain-containing protein n=1 Tax=Deinococcus aluminii TaxID=1656885 RepID=A0ABP9XIF1_9DEIO
MLLNTFEAAEQLRIAPATLRWLIKSGELRAYRLARAFRIDSADLEAFLRERAAR